MARWTGVAMVFASAALLAGCGGGGDDEVAADRAGDASTSAPAAQRSLDLTLTAAPSGRCMAPNVENLRAQDTAFEGTVIEVVDGTATLQVSDMYTGKEAETVTVATPAPDMAGLLLAVDFQQGQSYLVSSLDGQVSVCGLSGPKDELLAGLYHEAYPG